MQRRGDERVSNKLRGCALGVAIACTLLLAACGHDGGGASGGLASPAQWARTYGGPGDDIANAAQPTPDGGFVVAGRTHSFGAGGYDAWVVKLDGGGNVIWQKTYGGTGDDYADSIQSTADGGYVVAGALNGNLWVLKLDARGGVLWSRDYGTVRGWGLTSVQLTPDGGYIAANGALLKLDARGNVLWQKAFGGAVSGPFGDVQWDGPYADSVLPTPDGGYVVAGNSGAAAWVAKLDGGGGIVWQKISRMNVGPPDRFRSVQLAPDGGYIAAGTYQWHTLTHYIVSGVWVVKLDGGGNIVWQRQYRAGDAYDVQPTPDGGHVVAGYDRWYSGMEPTYRVLVFKLDARGTIVWHRTYLGTSDVGAYSPQAGARSVRAMADGGYIVAGFASVSGPQGDAWVLKLDSSGAIAGCAAMAESRAVAVDTTAPITDGAFTSSDTSFIPASNSAVSADSTAVPSDQCRYE